MKAAIIGVGQMGRATTWAMHKLGFDDLVIADVDADNLNECEALIDMKSSVWKRFINGSSSIEKYVVNKKYPDYSFIDKDVDVVISALPYHQNTQLAYHCVCRNVAYCDLGGNEGISGGINEMGRRYMRCSIMTDLGLAPGWVNIMAENMCQEYMEREGEVPHTVTMMVGGLPQCPNNTLKYSCTWSYDGLINEYRDSCLVLVDGQETVVRGMEGYQFPISSDIGTLEAFYTSGGTSHTVSSMKMKGIQNCCYKTLRYPSHHQIVNFLVHESGLDDKSLIDVFKNSCPPQKDLVIIKVSVDDWSNEKVIHCNSQFSAMQMATAFPLASAASIIADRAEPSVCTYRDIPYSIFDEKLNLLFNFAECL